MQVTISVDDGADLDYRLAKLFEKYDIDAVFYWPVDIQLLSMEKGWKALTPEHEQYIAERFEIGSHTITHRYLTQIPLDEAITEITGSKQILEEKYGREITKFCYPRGYANDTLKQAVKKAGYTYARSTAIGHVGKPVDPFFAGVAVHMGCPVRPEYDGTNWMEYGLKMYERAKEKDLDYEIFCHSWEIDRYNEWRNVEKFIKEVAK